MVFDKNIDEIDQEEIDEITDDLLKIYCKGKNVISKNECNKILNDLFKSLFDHKLKKKSFDCIYNNIKKNEYGKIKREDFEDISRALIISFNINYITNCDSFKDKICIKIGKNLLPIYYYIKKE
jgi:Ca2+-binding EF-hand superfamily protein